MIKNNKKGLTTIELLLSFILMMIIVIGMFRIVFNYKEKGRLLVISNELNAYKAVITKAVNDEMAVKSNIYAKNVRDCTYIDVSGGDAENVTCIDLFSGTDVNYRKRIVIASGKIVFGDMVAGALANEKKYPYPDANTSVSSSSVNISGTYTVITLILSNSTANNVQSNIVIYAKTTTQGPIAEIVLNKITGGDDSLDKLDTAETFIKGENPNNYLWYSGRMWRVVSILNDGPGGTPGSAKLVTDSNMVDLVYNTQSANAFSTSFGLTWLNNVFYPTLTTPATYIQSNSWNATYRANTTEAKVKPPTTTMVTSNVGLLNTYEYYKTVVDGLSYLNISKYWRTLTPSPIENYSSTNYPATFTLDGANLMQYKRAYLAAGIRPAVIIKAATNIMKGSGTLEDPYTFTIEKESDIVNDNLNTRGTGEYVNFANTLWRIVGVESGKTKLTMVSPLGTAMKFSNGGNAPTYGTGVTIGSYLNNTWYGSLTAKDKFMITLGTWSLTGQGIQGTYPTGTSDLVNLMVGMPRMGEMFSTSSINTSGTVYTLTPHPSTEIWYLQEGGYSKYEATDAHSLYPRASVYISSSVFITSGTGLIDNPFNVDITYEEVYDVTPNAPILADGMIPIKYDSTNNKWLKANSANTNYDWYNYAGKKWANAVMVTSATRTTYKNAAVGTEVLESNILAYFVWVPRFKYRSFNPTFLVTTPQLIDLQFESGTATTGSSSGFFNLYTHPAFNYGGTQLTGIWVAKFESSAPVGNACQTTISETNCNFTEQFPTVKPNQKAITYANLNVAYRSSQNMMSGLYLNSTNNLDIHLMKNTEWGAVAYLTMSRYGKGEDPYANNSTSYYTGRSSGGLTTSTANGTYSYNGFTCATPACDSGTRDENTKTLASGASTTGNIYGVYDMRGGAWEFVAGNYNNTTAYIIPTRHPSKNLDIYTGTTIASSKIGDALGEANGWYSRSSAYINSDSPWYARGSRSADNGTSASMFSNYAGTGDNHVNIGYRQTIAITSASAGSTTTGYVTSGLYLHFDGINNTGAGHSDSVSIWKNLIPTTTINSTNDALGVYLTSGFDLSTPGSSGSGWYPDSLQFDGVDDYMIVKTSYSYASPTIEMVVSYPTTTAADTFNNFNSAGYGLKKGPNSFQVYIDGLSDYRSISSTVPTVANKKYSVSGSFQSNVQLNLFENGVKYYVARPGVIKNAAVKLAVGCNPNGDGSCGVFINMRVYSIRLYNRALTDAEVLQNYAVDVARFGIS